MRLKQMLQVGCALLLGVILSNCTLPTQWSENLALASHGTRASHPALNDGKLGTVASAYPTKGKRFFTLTFPAPISVRAIIIDNENLRRFTIDYWNIETRKWETTYAIRTAPKRQHIGERLVQPQYVIENLDVRTNQIRINILQTVDDRMTATVSDASPADKRKPAYHGGRKEPMRDPNMSAGRIREIQVYNLLAYRATE